MLAFVFAVLTREMLRSARPDATLVVNGRPTASRGAHIGYTLVLLILAVFVFAIPLVAVLDVAGFDAVSRAAFAANVVFDLYWLVRLSQMRNDYPFVRHQTDHLSDVRTREVTMDLAMRRTVLALVILALAAYGAIQANTYLAIPAMAVAFALGAAALRLWLARRTARPATRRAAAVGIPLGVGVALFLTNAASAIDPRGPYLAASVVLAFAAGFVASLRLSRFGGTQV